MGKIPSFVESKSSEEMYVPVSELELEDNAGQSDDDEVERVDAVDDGDVHSENGSEYESSSADASDGETVEHEHETEKEEPDSSGIEKIDEEEQGSEDVEEEEGEEQEAHPPDDQSPKLKTATHYSFCTVMLAARIAYLVAAVAFFVIQAGLITFLSARGPIQPPFPSHLSSPLSSPRTETLEPLALKMDSLLKEIRRNPFNLDPILFPSHVHASVSSLGSILGQMDVLAVLVERTKAEAKVNWTQVATQVPTFKIPYQLQAHRLAPCAQLRNFRAVSLGMLSSRWTGAQRLALEMGGTLLTLANDDKEMFEKHLRFFAKARQFSGKVWVGATAPSSSSPWKWASPIQPAFTFPSLHAAAATASPVQSSARCLAVDLETGEWHSESCAAHFSFLLALPVADPLSTRDCQVF